MIDDLLNFSRIAEAKKSFVETGLNEVLRALLFDFEVTVKETGAQITCKLPLLMLCANRLQVRQLFHNLLSNALKFSSEEISPVITVSSRIVPPEDIGQKYNQLDVNKAYYEILFRDNGIEFNQEYAEKAFTIFQRLHERSKYPGTGIDLALCRKIADNHNGIVTVQSAENEGTAFTIILPEQQP